MKALATIETAAAGSLGKNRVESTPERRQGLAELSQLPTFFGFFALILIVKPCVFIVAF
jgi:hypothetical protein